MPSGTSKSAKPSGASKSTKPKESSKPKAAEVAAETKKVYFPLFRDQYASRWKSYSYLYQQPLAQLMFAERTTDISPPVFIVYTGDPVDYALHWAATAQCRIPFVCAANDKRPGGDWETGVVGDEARLCRRSTLAHTLATPGPGANSANYPISSTGGILSDEVVVFRGPHDRYEKLAPEQWQCLPVVSVPPTRWPKLTQNGTKYSFADEREMVKDKLRGALRICAYNNYSSVVIGDFGLGNGYRNPPQELAELWREVFLYDPDLRGRIRFAAFVFEDPYQSTTQLILDDIAKKTTKSSSSSSGRGKGKSSSSSGSSSGSSGDGGGGGGGALTDYQIFAQVFNSSEIQRVIGQPDSRYGLNNLLAE
ncbi:hypothetical protein QBC46DRAFT_428238 [Diplogelasinospora grovesii]|uniref:Microbial-type PARG catalytic domain-containing protein n=1 Tax=Diplogelasinospora grovesii TaxID=303347 RepID=A0AAN6NB83_9PEZI|nr:hypothetical protein QBC46DRAFT_428238 [Diplogelasinospora grovesii]